MKKIRINELARELEVKPGVIIALLTEFGVSDKKTHSSSIDEDVALAVRHRVLEESSQNGDASDVPESYSDTTAETARSKEKMTETSVAVAEPPSEEEQSAASAETARREPQRQEPARPSFPLPPRPQAKEPEQPQQAAEKPAPAPAPPEPVAETPATPEPEKSRSFGPLRPPVLSGGAIHPPLAAPSSQPAAPGPVNRTISMPARPIGPPVRPGLALTGPRQPLPAEPAAASAPHIPRPRPPRPRASS